MQLGLRKFYFVASLLVDAVLIALHFVLGEDTLPLSVAITLGAIASATAPAATLMVVRQYKADGPLTRLLLPIVALDDAVGLVVFSVSFGIAQAIKGGSLDMISVVVNPMLEIVFSLLLGGALGYVLSQLEKLFYSNSNRLSLTISFVLLTVALSYLEIPLGPAKISFSSLLVCMMLGTVFCNLSEYSADIMTRAEKWTAPLNATFFVLSGAALDLGVMSHPVYVLIGIAYIFSRSAGKYLGARESSKAMHCSPQVVKYLGITLLPQAGVALGMVNEAAVLGGIVAGPALLCMGIIVGTKAGKNLENARANAYQTNEICEELENGSIECISIRRRCYMFYNLLARLDSYLTPLTFAMEDIINTEGFDYSQFSEQSKKTIASAAATVSSIKAALDTPILTDSGALTVDSEALLNKMG